MTLPKTFIVTGSPDPTPSTDAQIAARMEAFSSHFSAMENEMGKVIVGNRQIIRHTLLCLLTGGHVLLEGAPGLGKTLLVRTLAQVLDLTFSRIQFTPDLMPADIIGTSILVADAMGNRTLQFQPGPLFGNLILADEINRATPKTQSALLEAMAERSASVGRTTHKMPEPFFVLATQNPLEMEGTYPLPEAQLDRFAVKLRVEIPTEAELLEIMQRTTGTLHASSFTLIHAAMLADMKNMVRLIPISHDLQRYIARLIMATHAENPAATDMVKQYVRHGSSPRGAQSIMLMAKAMALVQNRPHASLADIQAMAIPALAHRLICSIEASLDGVTPEAIIRDLLTRILPEPD